MSFFRVRLRGVLFLYRSKRAIQSSLFFFIPISSNRACGCTLVCDDNEDMNSIDEVITSVLPHLSHTKEKGEKGEKDVKGTKDSKASKASKDLKDSK